eukprot:COSAG01_NODE_563_length_15451_cov_70.726225_6_plen_935_part_00
MHSEGGRSWSLATEVPCWVCAPRLHAHQQPLLLYGRLAGIPQRAATAPSHYYMMAASDADQPQQEEGVPPTTTLLRSEERAELTQLREELRRVQREELARLQAQLEHERAEHQAQRAHMMQMMETHRADMQTKDEQIMTLMHTVVQAAAFGGGAAHSVVPRLSSSVTPSPAAPTATAAPAANNSCTASELVAQLQTGGNDSTSLLSDAFEHALTVLDALLLSIPRKRSHQRQGVQMQCEAVEAMLESLDQRDDTTVAWLSKCETGELTRLCQKLCEVKHLCADEADMDCVSVVSAAMKELHRCADLVTGASRQIASEEGETRLRALHALGGIARVVLSETVDAEVEVANSICEMGLDESRSSAERTAVWMALFALCFRNPSDTIATSLKVVLPEIGARVWRPLATGELDGVAGVAVLASSITVAGLVFDYGPKQPYDQSTRSVCENLCLAFFGPISKYEITVERLIEVLPLAFELQTEQDIVLACGAAMCLTMPIVRGSEANGDALVNSAEFPKNFLSLMKRVEGPELRSSAAWWTERSKALSLDTVALTMIWSTLGNLGSMKPHLPAGNAAFWEEMLAEAIHMMKVIQEAELTAQPCLPSVPLGLAMKVVSSAAQEERRRESMVASGVVAPLTYIATGNDYSFVQSLPEYAALATVALVGRNERGVTLTREVVYVVLDAIHVFFPAVAPDPSNPKNFLAVKNAKAPPNKILARVKPATVLIIADANKPLVLEHPSAVDDLVGGLLADEMDNPRREQAGAAQLQEICTAALLNLALNGAGKKALCANKRVLQSMIKMTEDSDGISLSDKARQSATAVLFELDDEAQEKARARRSQRRRQAGRRNGSQISAADIAAAVAAAASIDATSMPSIDEDTAAVEHIMLSYNWAHQDLVKRINSALKACGYTVWIDVEQMKGSTVRSATLPMRLLSSPTP